MNIVRRIDEVFDLVQSNSNNLQDPLSFEFAHSVKVLHSFCHLWQDYGSKTFMLSKDLIEAFQHTDIPLELSAQDFQYPFDTFVIEGCGPLFSTNTPAGPKPVEMIMVTTSTAVEEKVTFVTYEGKSVPKADWGVSIHGFFLNQDAGNYLGIKGFPEHLVFNTPWDIPLKDMLNMKKPGKLLYDLDSTDITNMINLTFNTILYINDKSRIAIETEVARVRSDKDHKTGKFHQTQYILLKPPKAYKKLTEESTGKKIDKRFIVRGHWRQQAFGENMKERRRMWIKPYWKGPEISEVVSKPYKVE